MSNIAKAEHWLDNIFVADNGKSVSSSYKKNIFSIFHLSDSNTNTFSESQGLFVALTQGTWSFLLASFRYIPFSAAPVHDDSPYHFKYLKRIRKAWNRHSHRDVERKEIFREGRGPQLRSVPARDYPLAPVSCADTFQAQPVAHIDFSPGFLQMPLNFCFDIDYSHND